MSEVSNHSNHFNHSDLWVFLHFFHDLNKELGVIKGHQIYRYEVHKMIEYIIIDIIYPLGLLVASNKHED